MAASVLADSLVSKLQDLADRVTALAGTTGNVTASNVATNHCGRSYCKS